MEIGRSGVELFRVGAGLSSRIRIKIKGVACGVQSSWTLASDPRSGMSEEERQAETRAAGGQL